MIFESFFSLLIFPKETFAKGLTHTIDDGVANRSSIRL